MLSHHESRKFGTYFSRSRSSSTSANDCETYGSADALEKAIMRETIMSIGSAPTLVEHSLASANRDSKQWDNAMLHAKRSSPTLRATEPFGNMGSLSEIQPLETARMRSALDGKEFDFGDDIWPYGKR